MRPIFRSLADGLAVLFWMLAFACSADAATSAVHIEWVRGQTVYGAQSLTSTGSSAASSAAPSFDTAGALGGVARVTATQGASIVVVGHATPTATQTDGFWIAPGSAPLMIPVAPGDEVAIIAATDTDASTALITNTGGAVPTQAVTVPIGGVGLLSEAGTSTQVTLTTGGTAQNLFGGVAPTNGYEVCNPAVAQDAWLSEATTAVANTGYRVPANGGCYDTPVGVKPGGVVSAIAGDSTHPLSLKQW